MRIAARLANGDLVVLAGDRMAPVRMPPGPAQTRAVQSAGPVTVPSTGLAAVIEVLGPPGSWPDPAPSDWEDARDAKFGIPTEPGTILGVGLNFVPHAADLRAVPTRLPTVFFKGRHTVIGPGEEIPLPPMSQRVTAEAELGLVVGRRMYRVAAEEALDYVVGACCVLDQTAEDILQQDARMLTVSKNFPGFFAFGPEIVSLDELASAATGGLADIAVSTCLNGEPIRSAPLSEMRFSPAHLLSFVSQFMPLDCGDILSTGTPGAVVVSPGDVVECRITGMRTLSNPVGAASAGL